MPAPLKILLVAHGLPPESVGGVEQHVEGLARELVRSGHQVTVFSRTATAGEQGTLVEQEWRGCQVVRVVYRHEGLASLQELYQCTVLDQAFARFLQGRQFDVAHVHHLTGISVGIIGVLRRAGVPVVMTLHDYWIMCPRGQMWHRREEPCESVEPARCADCLQPMFPQWLSDDGAPATVQAVHELARQTLGQADRLLTPSAQVVPFFERLGVAADRFHVVENGVDVSALKAVPEVSSSGPLRVGYLGTLIPSKGLHILTGALEKLLPRLAAGAIRLDVWGNAVPYHGDDTFLDRAFAGLPEDAPVHYHGPYATADLARILTGMDVVVAPALWNEAFGLTIREALAAGRAVLASRIGGLEDAIQDGVQGRLLAPGDSGALAEALLQLATDRGQLLRMARAARLHPSRDFATMARDLLDHYHAVLGSRR